MVPSGETCGSLQPWYISSFPLCAKNGLRFGSVAFMTTFSGCSERAISESKLKVRQSHLGSLNTTYRYWSTVKSLGSGPSPKMVQPSSEPDSSEGATCCPVRGLVAAV